MQTNTTRRTMIKALPLSAALIIAPSALAALPPLAPDAPILAAWEKHKAAREAYNTLPAGEPGEDDLWAIMDDAEETIRAHQATTIRGVKIQLLVSMLHSLSYRDQEAAVLREDIGYLVQHDSQLDWNDRLALAALQSLDAMGR